MKRAPSLQSIPVPSQFTWSWHFSVKIILLWDSQAASAVKDFCRKRANDGVQGLANHLEMDLVKQRFVCRFCMTRGPPNVVQNFPSKSVSPLKGSEPWQSWNYNFILTAYVLFVEVVNLGCWIVCSSPFPHKLSCKQKNQLLFCDS